MIATEYEKILSALRTVTHVLDSNQGQLNPADIRIRCLANITAKEAKRALSEADLTPQSPEAEQPYPPGVAIAQAAEPSR